MPWTWSQEKVTPNFEKKIKMEVKMLKLSMSFDV
jgi:hypothetical protein